MLCTYSICLKVPEENYKEHNQLKLEAQFYLQFSTQCFGINVGVIGTRNIKWLGCWCECYDAAHYYMYNLWIVGSFLGR